jgi:excisionase family DNA binding protein
MKMYSARETAKLLGVSQSTVIRWIEKGELKAKIKKTPFRKMYYVPEEEIERLKKEMYQDFE